MLFYFYKYKLRLFEYLILIFFKNKKLISKFIKIRKNTMPKIRKYCYFNILR